MNQLAMKKGHRHGEENRESALEADYGSMMAVNHKSRKIWIFIPKLPRKLLSRKK